MRRFSLLFMSFILLFAILTGCNFNQQDDQPPKTPVEEPEEPSSDNEDTNPDPAEEDNDSVGPPSNDQPVVEQSFEELYSHITNNPIGYIQSILPQFQIGMDQKQLIEAIGEPDQKGESQFDWEDEVWIYENIQGYRLQVQIVNQTVMNFQLMRSLNSSGRIPTLVNKSVPANQATVENTELGFEQVLIGASPREVLNRWGEPSMFYLTYDEMYGYDLALVYKGATVHVFLESEKPYVHLIETNQQGKLSTYRGITIGSSVEEVIRLYGPLEYDWKETESLIYATSDYWFAIKFSINNNKVSEISIYEAS